MQLSMISQSVGGEGFSAEAHLLVPTGALLLP